MIYPDFFKVGKPHILMCIRDQGGGGVCCHGAHNAHKPGCGRCHQCNDCDYDNGCTDGYWVAGCKDGCKEGCSDGCSDSTCSNATCNPCYGCQGCNSCYGCNGTCDGCNRCDGCQTCVECQTCVGCQSCNSECYEENSGYDQTCREWYAKSRFLNRTYINCSNSCSRWH